MIKLDEKVKQTPRRCGGFWQTSVSVGELLDRKVRCDACGRKVGIRWIGKQGHNPRVFVQPHNKPN